MAIDEELIVSSYKRRCDPLNDTVLQNYLRNGQLPRSMSLRHKRRMMNYAIPFAIVNNKLTHHGRAIPPIEERYNIASNMHSTCAHRGVRKTASHLLSQYWPNLFDTVKLVSKNCEACLKFGDRATVPSIPTVPQHIDASEPFSTVGIDITYIVFDDEDDVQHTHALLVMVDHTSKWIEAVPLCDTSARTVAKALWENVISRLGYVNSFISDNGPEFIGNVIKELTLLTGVEHHFATPYHPQTNSLAEKTNHTIKQALVKLLKGYVSNG